ncbi:MAG: histidine phosphatase family protein [Candidatus Paceibacterota bacterium]|jgi:broad specificity phosphatase PhoE
MKWPASFTIVRHGQSEYNVLRAKKEASTLYQEFKKSFEQDPECERTHRLALEVQNEFALGTSDYETRLTEEGMHQARETGKKLSTLIAVPNVVFVSPYLRTRNTFECIAEEWPALADVKIVYDDRIREQEHGLSLLYNDRRVFHALHPEQRKLFELMGPYWYRYPQGESVSDTRDREREFAGMLIREYSEADVLAITHHLTILSTRANHERLTPEQFIHLDENHKPVNCGVTNYIGNPYAGSNGKLELEFYNKQLWE